MTSPTIHQAIASVLAELPAIGKNQRNQGQNFNFRGIDDVLDALNPLLAKHGVFFMPTVIERLESERQLSSGKSMWVVDLHVRYTFYGPAGDSLDATGWGEGTDMGDKATQKAMTGAMKYVLFQVFAIATHEQADSDADTTTPEPTSRRRPPAARVDTAAGAAGPAESSQATGPAVSKNRRDALKSRCVALQADGVSVADARESLHLPLVDSCDAEQMTRFEALVDTLEKSLTKPFESPRPDPGTLNPVTGKTREKTPA